MREIRVLLGREFADRVTALEATVDTADTGLADRVGELEATVDTASTGLTDRVEAVETGVQDTATITLDTVIATDAVVVNGTTLTFIAPGTPGVGEVAIGTGGTSDNTAATNLAAKISTIDGLSAVAAAKVVTVTGDPNILLVITTDDTTLTVAYTSPATSIFALTRTLIAAS